MRNLANLDLKKKYILSFAFVSIVPIMIIILLLFIPVNNLFKAEVMKTDTLKSKQLRDIMDARTTEIYNIAAQLSLDIRVKEFLYSKAPLDYVGNYYVNDVSKVVRSCGTGNSFISFIAIYFKNGSMVVTSDGKYNDEYFFQNVLKYEEINPTKLKEFMSQTYYSKSMPLAKITSTAAINGKYVTYIQSIPIGEKSSAANIIILVEEKNMIVNTGEINFENKEQIVIIDNDGKVIFSNGEDYTLKQGYIDKILASNNSKAHFDSENPEDLVNSFEISTEKGGNAIASYAKSNINDWTYVVISDIANIVSKVNQIRNLSIFIILLTLAITIFLSLIMGDLSYSPWGKLTQYIAAVNNSNSNNSSSSSSSNNNNNNKKASKYGNEYQFAVGAIENLLLEKVKLQHDVDKSKSYIINQILLNICTGKGTPTELNSARTILSYKSTAVITADFEDKGNLKSKISIILTRWTRFFLKNSRLFAFTDERNRLCIVLNTDPLDNSTIINKINSYKNTFSKHFNITLYAGVGNYYTDIEKLYNSYSEAKKSLEYCYIKGDDIIVFFPEIEKHIFSSLNLPVHSGNPLLNSVKIGDYKTCSKLLNEYFDNIAENAGNASISYMYCLFYNFVSVILKACEEISVDFINVFGESPEQILDIDNYRNARQMIERVYNMYMTLCEFVQKNKTSQNITLKKQVEDIIKGNYINKNFSLIELADHLGYSSSYLSRFINQEFGTGFGELLNNERLEKSKSFLCEGNRQIGEIADEVGYSSVNSFIRTFKRVEGVTPKQYRDIQFSSKHKEI